MMDELLEEFIIEGREMVRQAEDDLLALERAPGDAARIDSAFRAVHTLKGSAALFDFTPMTTMLHDAEDLLGAMRAAKLVAGPGVIGALLDCTALVEGWVEAIARDEGLPADAAARGGDMAARLRGLLAGGGHAARQAPAASAPGAALLASQSAASRALRVDAARIDALMELASELMVARNRLGHLVSQAAARDAGLARALADSEGEIGRIASGLHGAVLGIRMTRLGRSFRRLPRLVRDIAATLGKEVTFEITGDEVEADRAIVDGLFEPLLHVLRNAVDHGIETPQARRAAGKPDAGRVHLSARREADQIVLAVADDGAGIDPSRLRETARRRGLMDDAAIAALDDAAAARLVFLPGFSTADQVSDISGRGVGLDAVRSAIEALGGRVTLASTPGAGSTLRLSLPRALTVSQILVVTLDGERFGVPIEQVLETTRLAAARILPVRAGEAFVLHDRTVPLLALSRLLDRPASARAARGDAANILVIAAEDGPLGIEVDGFGERIDVLLRPLNGLLAGMAGMAGGALLGDGQVLLVLDLPELVASVLAMPSAVLAANGSAFIPSEQVA